jgi:hypothetical protein
MLARQRGKLLSLSILYLRSTVHGKPFLNIYEQIAYAQTGKGRLSSKSARILTKRDELATPSGGKVGSALCNVGCVLHEDDSCLSFGQVY